MTDLEALIKLHEMLKDAKHSGSEIVNDVVIERMLNFLDNFLHKDRKD